MSRQRIAIMHGSFGSPDGNWFRWLEHQCEAMGHDVVVPKFPTPEGQNLTSWTDVASNELGTIGPDTVLVGHSLAVAFILRLLESSPSPVHGVVLVCGFIGTLGLPDFDAVNDTFVNGSFDWDSIRANCGKTLLVAGEGDPYVPQAKGLEIASQLKTALHVVPGGKHLNAEAGFQSFPYLLEMMKRLIVND